VRFCELLALRDSRRRNDPRGAVTPDGVPLGLLTQAFFTRPIGAPAHQPRELQKLPIEEKESYRWLQAFEQTLALVPGDVQVVEATVSVRFAPVRLQPPWRPNTLR
jgi:hypothetical protein